jgi:hypothetical protein
VLFSNKKLKSIEVRGPPTIGTAQLVRTAFHEQDGRACSDFRTERQGPVGLVFKQREFRPLRLTYQIRTHGRDTLTGCLDFLSRDPTKHILLAKAP